MINIIGSQASVEENIVGTMNLVIVSLLMLMLMHQLIEITERQPTFFANSFFRTSQSPTQAN
jgi:hypothetical protein